MDIERLWLWAEQHHGLARADELRRDIPSRRKREAALARDFERLSPRVMRRRGAPRTPYQSALAAVLDAGVGAFTAGRSAPWLWNVPGYPFLDPVELTRERGRSGAHRPTLGIVRERRLLTPEHVTTVAGIPTVTVPVMLYELAAIDPRRFERAADTIVGRSPAVLRAMHALLPQLGERGRNGITLMRQYLDLRPPGARVPTGLEGRFERNLEEAHERPMVRQVDLGGHEWIGRVDYLDRDVGLVAEIQSQTFHDSFVDRAADDLRVAELLDAGFRGVLLIPDTLVWYEPRRMIECVRLARRALTSPDPTRFVSAIRATGARFELTERREGRMSA